MLCANKEKANRETARIYEIKCETGFSFILQLGFISFLFRD